MLLVGDIDGDPDFGCATGSGCGSPKNTNPRDPWLNPKKHNQSHAMKGMAKLNDTSRRPLFPRGKVVATQGAMAALIQSGDLPNKMLTRHVTGDWGDVCNDDKKLNDAAVQDGERLLSSYRRRLLRVFIGPLFDFCVLRNEKARQIPPGWGLRQDFARIADQRVGTD